MEGLIPSVDVGLGTKKVSKLILGTSILQNNKDCALILNTAIEYGINTFDLAPSFLAHDKLKQWIATLRTHQPQVLDRLVFILKGGFPIETKPGHYQSRLRGTAVNMEKTLRQDLSRTLSFLDLAKADIYFLHRDDEDYVNSVPVLREKTPVATIQQAVESPKMQALYSQYGVSNWADERVLELQSHRQSSLVTSSFFSLWERNRPAFSGEQEQLHKNLINPDYLPGCINLTYSPFSGYYGAMLCIKGFEEAKQAAQKSMYEPDKEVVDTLFTPTNRLRAERLRDFTNKLNVERFTSYSAVQVAGAYALAHPRVSGCMCAACSIHELDMLIQTYDLSKTLTPADLAYLHDVS